MARRLISAATLFLVFVFWLLQMQVTFAAIDNTARAVGVYNGSGVSSATSAQSIPVVTANPQVSVNKTGSLNDDDGTPGLSAGDTISYTITVNNPGNVSLTGVSVSDPLIALTFQSGDTDFDNQLDPGETWTYTGSYTVSSFDLATDGGGDGDIDNTVTVSTNETGPVSDTVETKIDPDVAITVLKSGMLNDDDGIPGLSAGDTIDYQIAVENSGVADLTTVSVADNLVQSGVSSPLVPSFASGDLNSDNRINPGETWLYAVSYVLTQANIDDGGNLVNTASVTTDQIGPRNSVHTQILAGIFETYTMTNIATLADVDSDNLGDVGEVINYTKRFTNTGNRTLSNMLVIDPSPGMSAMACANDLDADGDIDVLAPGQTMDCVASYTVQPPDVLAGSVVNAVTTTATRLNGLVPRFF